MPATPLAENPFRHAAWRTYTPASGLAGLQVEHIVQDRDGLLWFATAFSGVSCFDGDTFQTFTRQNGLCGNQVLYILRDSQERLWFATLDGGVCGYDGHAFDTPDALRGIGPVVDCLLEDRDGMIWLIGPDLLCTYDGERVRDLLPEFRRQCGFSINSCWGLDQDATGDVWIAVSRLVRYDGEQFHLQGSQEGLAEEMNLCTIGRDGEGSLWMGSTYGLMRWDGDRLERFELEDGLADFPYLAVDGAGRLWLGRSHVHGPPGLRYFDGSGAMQVDTEVPICKETAVAVDAVGRLLVGHVNESGEEWQLVRHDGQRWEVLLHLTGRGIVRLATGEDGRIWFTQGSYFGTTQGKNDASLGQLRPDGTVLWHPLDEAMAGNPTNGRLVDAQGQVWVANGSNLSCFDGERYRVFGADDGLPPGQLLCLYEDRQGHLWVGTENGAVCYDGTVFQVVRDPNIAGAVRDIHEDGHGHLWFATSRGWSGTCRVKPGRWSEYCGSSRIARTNGTTSWRCRRPAARSCSPSAERASAPIHATCYTPTGWRDSTRTGSHRSGSGRRPM